MPIPLAALVLLLAGSAVAPHAAAAQERTATPDRARADARAEARIAVRLQPDEGQAALDLAGQLAAGRTPTDADWERLFASEGYRRLVKREAAIGRPLTDSAFRAFVRSPALAARLPALRATLREWSALDPAAAAERAFAYLPAGARIRATIYPVVKPATNSFVFETRTDPAIFLYVDPAMSAAQFQNVLAHELHHIGIASACGALADSAALAEPVRTALGWMGALHEGVAMLAAAGGPDVHPHATSDSAERATWERDVARVEHDLRRLERFYGDILDGRLVGDAQRRVAMSFFSSDSVPQGAHYTVGWVMASAVERAVGRERLVEALCDPRRLLALYDRAASRPGSGLPRWSPELMRRLGVTER